MPDKKKRVAIALSGGVDSAVAALLLKQQGYELIAFHLLIKAPETDNSSRNLTTSTEEIQQFCDNLHIPLYILDLHSEFEIYVINYFCQQYAVGYTPNPCIMCNKHIKFGVLLNKALSFGASSLATGHYATIKYYNGSYHLFQGIDEFKDQSYVLYQLNQSQLSCLLFPVGKYKKTETIDIAIRAKLRSANRKSSQDICFIDGNYTDFLLKYDVQRVGDIVNRSGDLLGKHRGVAFYTVGQRCRLGVNSRSRLYVVGIDGANNRIIVGTKKETYQDELLAKDVNWIADKPPENMEGIEVRIRYKSDKVRANLINAGDCFHIQLYEPQRSISPGQSVVFYRGSEVLGGGTIEKCKY